MQTELPRRPFVEQLPPPDGLGVVRREATRRRRRKAVGVVTGGVTAAVVTVAAVLAGGGVDGDAVLRPAPAPPAVQLPSPGGAPVSQHPVVSRLRNEVAAHAQPADGGGFATSAAGGGGGGSGSSARSQNPAAQSITLTRTRSAYTGAPRFCRTGDTVDSRVHPGDDWCFAAAAVVVRGGVRLSLQACRDSTTAGNLTFASSRELDLVLTHGGRTVWSWSRAHPGTPSQHSLTAPADGCWNWSLVWPGVTQSGSGAAHGAYVLTAISTADEFYGASPATVTFDY
jgi:hypothetical protein